MKDKRRKCGNIYNHRDITRDLHRSPSTQWHVKSSTLHSCTTKTSNKVSTVRAACPPPGRTQHHIIFRSRYCNARQKFTTQLTTNLIIILHPRLYSAFMYVTWNNSTISATSSNYKVQPSIIKNLLANVEAHQHSIISKQNKTLVESINQIQITRWAKNRIFVKHKNQ